ncbi:MAG: hypothetical protein GY754_42320 [bacterium]|nr:hypothetical protein [bacterium]
MAGKITLIKNRNITKSDIDALYELKNKYLPLSRDVDPDDDFRAFNYDIQTCDVICVIRSKGDEKLRGFYIIKKIISRFNGKKSIFFYSDYGIVEPAYRGQFQYWAKGIMYIGLHALKHFSSQKYFIGHAFPDAYINLRGIIKKCFTLNSREIPEKRAEVFYSAAYEIFGNTWDPRKGIVSTGSYPLSRNWKLIAEAGTIMNDYEELNPGWRKGSALAIFLPMDMQLVLTAFRNSFFRLLKIFKLRIMHASEKFRLAARY